MLSWEEYFDRIINVQVQFDLTRKALAVFQETPEAVQKYMEGEIGEIRNILTEKKVEQPDEVKQHWAFTPEGTSKFFASVKADIPKRISEIENRINQNELIMRVTLYDAFMKDIHREILRQKPTLLKSDRQIALGKLISTEKDKIVEEEILREVQSLDRKNTEDKAKYFKKTLGIQWFDDKIVPLLDDVLEQRNLILHETPDEKIKKVDLDLVHVVCFAIPWITIAQAAVLYPGGFKMIDGLDEVKARTFIRTTPIN